MVKLYTIHCPACDVLQKKLDMKSINYELITSEDVFRELGIDMFPVLQIDDGPLMNFTSARKWVDAQEV